MPGYIPSRRILREGGYEADFSQVYYEQPGRYDPSVEEPANWSAVNSPPSRDRNRRPFTSRPVVSRCVCRLAGWVGGERSETEQQLIQTLRRYVRIAQPP